jgi:transketolase
VIAELKKRIVQAAYESKEGHIASAFSILDILWVLHNEILRPDDCFILSKGHASLALYAILSLDLSDFAKYGSRLGGHPDRNKAVGVTASTGSLGHGLPMAVGISLARKIKGVTGRVFCVIGDGECNEGSIWEACLLAAHHKLDNLTLIVDYNHSNDKSLSLENLRDKLDSFNFLCLPINGHNHDDIRTGLRYFRKNRPIAVIAETIKGKDCKRMENNPEWHHKIPNAVELTEILEELSCGNN